MFDTLIVFIKESFEKVDFGKNQQTTQMQEKNPRGQRTNVYCLMMKLTNQPLLFINIYITVKPA